jgi:hypothetical protein
MPTQCLAVRPTGGQLNITSRHQVACSVSDHLVQHQGIGFVTMKKQAPLLHQPGSFWIGAALVAEAPAALVIWMLPTHTKEVLIEFFMSGPWGIACALAIALTLFLATAWAGHKLHLGS